MVSIAKSSSDGFSAITPLHNVRDPGNHGEVKGKKPHPWIIWSRTSSRPEEICVTSTFLRQAFFPLRLGCLYCAGAALASAFAMVLSWRIGFREIYAVGTNQN